MKLFFVFAILISILFTLIIINIINLDKINYSYKNINKFLKL